MLSLVTTNVRVNPTRDFSVVRSLVHMAGKIASADQSDSALTRPHSFMAAVVMVEAAEQQTNVICGQAARVISAVKFEFNKLWPRGRRQAEPEAGRNRMGGVFEVIGPWSFPL